MNVHAKKRLGMVLATMVVTCAFGAEWIAGSYSPPPETDEAAFFKEAPNDLVRVVFAAKDVPTRRAIWRFSVHVGHIHQHGRIRTHRERLHFCWCESSPSQVLCDFWRKRRERPNHNQLCH